MLTKLLKDLWMAWDCPFHPLLGNHGGLPHAMTMTAPLRKKKRKNALQKTRSIVDHHRLKSRSAVTPMMTTNCIAIS